MTVFELRAGGAIYFENIVEGMKRYENQIVSMDWLQAREKFLELWKLSGCRNMYVDFYYFTLPPEAKAQVDAFLSPKERRRLAGLQAGAEDVIFPADEALISICTRLNEAELLFSTFYTIGDCKSVWWGNYGKEYIVFTEKAEGMESLGIKERRPL